MGDLTSVDYIDCIREGKFLTCPEKRATREEKKRKDSFATTPLLTLSVDRDSHGKNAESSGVRQERNKKRDSFSLAREKIWHALCGSGEQQSEESQVQHTSDCETTNWSRGSGKRVAPLVTKVERTSCTVATLHTRVTTSSSTPAQSLPVAGRGETTLRPRPQSTRAAVGCISLPCPQTIRNLTEREKNMRQRENIPTRS